MPTTHPKNILIAPLDWGLGHTTRCVPVIRHIRSMGHRVIVAGNEWQRTFLAGVLGDMEMVPLEGYNVTYSKWNRYGQAGIVSQLPQLYKTIAAEHKWLQQKTTELQLHGIISDNRYGLYHAGIPSVIMTHQLNVLSGMGKLADRMVQKMHYKHLDRFNATWVPDIPTSPGLGGMLSHTTVLPKHNNYLGLLSQFETQNNTGETEGSLLVLLSGPEPQRSELSRILWQQVVRHKGHVIFVEGSNNVTTPANIPEHITYYKWLAGEQLMPLLRKAGMIICRSGYSTLMDLVALQKKAILIPTPGQTEQEYLARHLYEHGVFYAAKQNGFDLGKTWAEAKGFPFNALELQQSYSLYKPVVDDWLHTL